MRREGMLRQGLRDTLGQSRPAYAYKDRSEMNQQLNMGDATFLYVETKHSPMHIAGLQILDVPIHRRNTFFAEMQRHVAARAPMVSFMTRRVVASVLDLDHPHWETVDQLDIDYHVRLVALPKPGSIANSKSLSRDCMHSRSNTLGARSSRAHCSRSTI